MPSSASPRTAVAGSSGLASLLQVDALYAKRGFDVRTREAEVFELAHRTLRASDKPADEAVEVFKGIRAFYQSTYAGMAVPTREPAGFVRVYGDTYAVSVDSPWHLQLSPQSEASSTVPADLRLLGLPSHLWQTLSLRQQNDVIRRVQEFQLHFTRLTALDETGSVPFLSLALGDLQQCAYSACLAGAPDYNGARWSAVHACEKLLKAVVQAGGAKPAKTHRLEKLAKQVKSVTGLHIPPRHLDPIEEPTLLRYSTGSSYEEAERAFLQTLRLSSFVFPYLASKYSRKDEGLVTHTPAELRVLFDELLFLSKYPGVFTPKFWQPTMTGLYGDTVEFQPRLRG